MSYEYKGSGRVRNGSGGETLGGVVVSGRRTLTEEQQVDETAPAPNDTAIV